jgi:hypothetical protein
MWSYNPEESTKFSSFNNSDKSRILISNILLRIISNILQELFLIYYQELFLKDFSQLKFHQFIGLISLIEGIELNDIKYKSL